jgi:hypothetical protein
LGFLHGDPPRLGFPPLSIGLAHGGELLAQIEVAAGIAVPPHDRLDLLRARRAGLTVDERDQPLVQRE